MLQGDAAKISRCYSKCCRVTRVHKQRFSGRAVGTKLIRNSSKMSFKGFVSCNSKISKEDKDFYDLKNKAAEFYRANCVPQRIETVLNEIFLTKPNDIYGYLGNYFSSFSHTPVISTVVGREVYDARGEAALKVDVYCIIRNEEKLVSDAVVTSLDSDIMETLNVVADGNRLPSVEVALNWIKDHLSSMVHGIHPTQQTHLDKLLSDFYIARYLEDQEEHSREKKIEEEELSEITSDTTTPNAPTSTKGKGKKGSASEKPLPPPEKPEPMLPGAMAVGAMSMAAAKSAASMAAVPLYKHILTLRDPQHIQVFLPVPLVSMLSCGKTSSGKLNLLEEVILLPTVSHKTREIIKMCRDVQREIKSTAATTGKSGSVLVRLSEGGAIQLGLDRPEQALDLLMEACSNLGLPIGTELRLVINCAAHALIDYSKGKYEVMAGTLKSPDELVEMYVGLINKYPAIAALIDPFRKEDVEQWQKLSSRIGQSCCLIADAAYSSCPRWRGDKPLPPGVTWITIRQRGDMTLTDLLHAVTERTEEDTILAVSSDEIGDDSMIDVAVGLGVSFLKLGGLAGGGRMNKYNRLHRIEQELEEQGILAGMREVKLPRESSPDEELTQTGQTT